MAWQKVEINGVLARNVEFSQLIVDYQRKLRETSESLNSAEELSRKLTIEVDVVLDVVYHVILVVDIRHIYCSLIGICFKE